MTFSENRACARRARRVLTIAVASAALAAAASLAQPPAAAVEELRAEIAALRSEYDGRLAALEARLAALEGGTAATMPSAAAPPATVAALPPPSPTEVVPAPPAVPVPGGGATTNYFNPSTAIIGNFLAAAGDNPVEDLSSVSLEEAELSFQAVVDPYARADFFIGFGEEGAEIEEGFITFTALPAALQAKAGRMKVPFGKINALHFHQLPWIDAPLPIVNLLGGDEGWIGDGVSLSRLIPLPADTFSELTLQVFRGEAEGLFVAAERSDLAYHARYRLFRDLTEAVNLDLGASYAWGPNETVVFDIEGGEAVHAGDTRLGGLDVTWRWKPLQTALYRSAIVRGELLRSRREQPGGTASALGWVLGGDLQLARRWFLGARLESAERADDDTLRDEGQAAILTFWPSEFSQLRAELRRRRYAEGETADELLLQLQFAIGAHGAHAF